MEMKQNERNSSLDTNRLVTRGNKTKKTWTQKKVINIHV